ncbi:MtrAB system accessory lipoprotein LpqB [Corynebacterium kefirresidentii]|uniref:Lipoprotein LpqB n=1 Tax=Corynebacterium kefirresidentii TaxID=1979527 RepID=A0ABT8Q5H3_9CORY|nr:MULTISPECIES: MtrAB system accessory lipoprotein LpqB [Corynebacterium]MCT2188210.1 MtrAB system accessory lipoprotein LpqB [Corynebacterium kefirresidentii]MDN8620093.1 MtrAB system accessory lipoprotein LpqB [Corynebacterium kefirresidentii]MDN8633750.1 MtrAB system accessory lipoprotein LpqB [Corynebacterium kefirresidentii]MDN8640681.1 MtrAB system accessory lipoprotein LpqB [Corynebacterium kefirresidentii]MDU3165878.1 MtrAB system accessory lipoprotein LpqB [Corynebacterium sp.]
MSVFSSNYCKTAVFSTAAVVLFVSGCSTLPSDTGPQVVGTYQRQEDSPGEVIAPQPGDDPDLTLRDFYQASAVPGNDHEVARGFLTDTARGAWDASGDVMVVDSLDIVTAPANKQSSKDNERAFTVRGTIIGRLKSGGAYVPENEGYEAVIYMKMQDDRWRVDGLPAGVVMERNEMRNHYAPQSLYFYKQSNDVLVPDRRWLYKGGEESESTLITLLMEGPSASIAPATRRAAGENVTYAGYDREQGYQFEGLVDLDAHDRTLFAAQLVWTLSKAGHTGPFKVKADGGDLVEGMDSLSVDDFADYNPEESSTALSKLYALNEGNLLEVDDGVAEPVQSTLGSSGDVQSVDVADSGLVAAVRRKSNNDFSLQIGELDGQLQDAVDGPTLARPTFEYNGQAAWTVVDGDRIVRVVRSKTTGRISKSEVDARSIDDIEGEISVIRLSHSGARVAMVIDGHVYIAAVAQSSSGDKRIVNAREVGPEVSGSALSLDWNMDGSLIVGTSSSQSPVWRIEQDGSSASTMPTGNITAPVVAVASSPTKLFITDSHAMLELPSTVMDETNWREVSGLQGRRSSPIVSN